MKVHYFKSCPSTQTVVSEFISAKHKLPFAVVSQTQTAGRGRQGRSWKSPSGNIYLTLALNLDQLSMADRPMLSVIVGVSICKWLQKQFQVNATLKWPNDIYFAGRKLCGVLCDTSFEGDRPGPVLIGVGMNCQPVKDSSLHATSLKEITSEVFSAAAVKKFAMSLAQYLNQDLRSLDSPSIYDRIDESVFYTPSIGFPLIDSHQEIISYAGMDRGGVMLLQRHSNDASTILSAEHGFEWPMFSKGLCELAIADIGNTRTKISLCNGKKTSEFKGEYPFGRIFAASVNEEGFEKLRLESEKIGVKVFKIKKRAIRARYPNYDFFNFGIDRACLIEDYLGSARKSFKGAVIVSLGTAVTIDIVRNNGEHVWGVIAPGLQTMLDALHEKTSKLPKVRYDEVDFRQKVLSTDLAMTNGCAFAIVGLIKEACGIAKSELKSFELYFVGGDARKFTRAFPRAKIDQISVQSGAYKMLRGG